MFLKYKNFKKFENNIFDDNSDSVFLLKMSNKFKDILKKMNNPISDYLLSINNKEKTHITYLDVSDVTNRIKYVSSYRVNINKVKIDENRIGRVLIKIKQIKDNFKQSDIENFVNEYIGVQKNISNDKLFVVYGDDIKKWYNGKKYIDSDKGTLSKSCMRYVNNSFFDIYGENDKNNGAFSHIGMLILLDDDNKLRARSLIWFNSIRPEPHRVYMDRVYYTSQSEITIFHKYAIEHGWLYKYRQTYGDNIYIDPKDNRKHSKSLTFRLKNKKYKYYPYLDTLVYYTPETGRISSTPNKNRSFKTYILRDQHGRANNV